ncbi:hypothetical protein BaRGS_00011070 [Batillaria attramentaria]|uniref:Uncharacterized protein n=1 Tax=Batillaria attramentaria TaxID=370345 RepID=A0ABD0LE14_9CAEN
MVNADRCARICCYSEIDTALIAKWRDAEGWEPQIYISLYSSVVPGGNRGLWLSADLGGCQPASADLGLCWCTVSFGGSSLSWTVYQPSKPIFFISCFIQV